MNHWLLCLFPSSLSNRPGFRNRVLSLVLLGLAACLLSNCQDHEDQPSPTVALHSTDAVQPEHSTASSPPPLQPPNPIVETQASSSCCDIVANPDLKGRLGRLVVNFPEGTKPASTRIDAFKPGEQKTLVGGFGGHTFELLPGTYDVEISKKRLTGVLIQSAHDTRVKVGVLQVNAGGSYPYRCG